MQDGLLQSSEHLDRLQAGLAVLAKHDRATVVYAMDKWSQDMIRSVSRAGDPVGVVTRKRIAVRPHNSRHFLLSLSLLARASTQLLPNPAPPRQVLQVTHQCTPPHP